MMKMMNWYKKAQRMILVPEEIVEKLYLLYLSFLPRIEKLHKKKNKNYQAYSFNAPVSFYCNSISNLIEKHLDEFTPYQKSYLENKKHDLSTIQVTLIIIYTLTPSTPSTPVTGGAHFNSSRIYVNVSKENFNNKTEIKDVLRHELEHIIYGTFNSIVRSVKYPNSNNIPRRQKWKNPANISMEKGLIKDRSQYLSDPEEIRAFSFHIAKRVLDNITDNINNDIIKLTMSTPARKEIVRKEVQRLITAELQKWFKDVKNDWIWKKYFKTIFANLQVLWINNIKQGSLLESINNNIRRNLNQ